MFERLGDLYLELDDEAQALAAYGEARQGLRRRRREEQVSLLEKMLKLQRSTRRRPRPPPRPRRCSSSWSRIPKERAERRREAALLMAERGDVREAAELLEQALVEDPQDEAALVALCELADRAARRASGCREKLARALAGLPRPPTPTRPSRRRRAALWQRHGELARKTRPGRAPSRRSSRSSRSTPSSWRRARRSAALYGDRPGYEDAGDREPPPAARRSTSRAPIRCARWPPATRAAAWSIARAAATRCCRCSGRATKDEEGVPGGAPVAELKPDDPYAVGRSTIRTGASTWPCPRRR